MAESGPTVRGRRLAAELRKLREDAGLTPEDAARAFGWSRPKLVRIELAQRMPSLADVSQILDAYGGANEAIKSGLMQLARDIRQRGWWAAYGDVLAGSYVELEDAANRIQSWQVQLVPGLLQTPEYARELIQIDNRDPAEIDHRVQARMTRHTLLTRQAAPKLEVVLAEGVLHHPVGGPDVMRDQLNALLVVGERPNISIRVVPTSRGSHPGVGQGSVVIFEFATPMDLGVAYLETLAGGMYVEDMIQVQRCNVMFDRIADTAMSEEESAAFIAAIAQGE